MARRYFIPLIIIFFVAFSSSIFAQPRFAQVERINSLIAETWNDYQIKPSPKATDAEWCRRLFLDLLGRIPTIEEVNQFVESKDRVKHEQLVTDLLYGDEYTEEFARNWTTIWTNLLIGRTGGNGNNSMVSRAGMQKYLRDSFARGKPFDKFVYELVTATGRTTPGSEDFNGATNYLIDKVNDDKGSLATATTSRMFLGLQVQCTQCHDHPFNEWKQQKYWEMNAFFRQARAFGGGRNRMDNAPAQLKDQDFNGEGRPRNPQKPPIFYELRNGEVRVAYPVFVDGTKIDPSGYVKVANRRQELAKLIINSEYFPKAIANRIWAHFLGYGFTSPVDDLGPHNPPTHPELLGFLGEEFRNSGFNLRDLISWIVLSKPYLLSSKLGKSNSSDDPLLGEAPKFSRFYLRQMRAEELYESLLIANDVGFSDNYEEKERLKNRWLQQFSLAFGTDEGDETTTFNGTIPQVLMMFNGDLVERSTNGSKGSMLKQLSNSNLNFKGRIDHLFKAGLSRKPKRMEYSMAQQFLQYNDGNMNQTLSDVWWVVLNSNEFIFNH